MTNEEVNNVIVKLYGELDKDLSNKLKSFMKHLNTAQKEIDDISVDHMFNILDDGIMSTTREQLILELKKNSKQLICFLNILKCYTLDAHDDR